MRIIKITGIILLVLFLFMGCDNETQEPQNTKPRVKAVLKASGAETIKATVYVEGPDGNALNGSVVTIKDSRNILTQLEYSSSTCSYNGTLTELSGDTTYVVEASTILSPKNITINIPYTRVEIVPNVTIFQDAAGASVLKGNSLASEQPIHLGWSDCGAGTNYQLSIKTALKTVYSVSTNACIITVPANSIPPGSYSLEISAQKAQGDIYLRSLPYYSVSAITAPLVSCSVF